MSYIPCVIFGLFLYDVLFIHGYDDMIYAQGYLIYVTIGLVFLVILIRAYYLYSVYKDHAKRMYICKKNKNIDNKVTFKKGYLEITKDEEKNKVDYKNIVFIGKVDLVYLITYFDNETYKMVAIGNVDADDSIINELLPNCPNLKLKKILLYQSKRNSCILLFVLIILLLVINAILYVLTL